MRGKAEAGKHYKEVVIGEGPCVVCENSEFCFKGYSCLTCDRYEEYGERYYRKKWGSYPIKKFPKRLRG